MQTKIIEASQDARGASNWGKFMLGRFDDEWSHRSALAGVALLSARGWDRGHLLFLDLETGEGAVLRPGGVAGADLEKHRVWVCPLAEPFLEWLYRQDLADLDALPSYVELPDAPFAMAGYRRPGGSAT